MKFFYLWIHLLVIDGSNAYKWHYFYIKNEFITNLLPIKFVNVINTYKIARYSPLSLLSRLKEKVTCGTSKMWINNLLCIRVKVYKHAENVLARVNRVSLRSWKKVIIATMCVYTKYSQSDVV